MFFNLTLFENNPLGKKKRSKKVKLKKSEWLAINFLLIFEFEFCWELSFFDWTNKQVNPAQILREFSINPWVTPV